MEVIIEKESQTKDLAARIATILKGGETIALNGPLGAGKTTFTRYLVAVLGGSQSVASPSFVLMHDYQTSRFQIEHWDLYRLRELPEDLLEAPARNMLRVVEWADKFSENALNAQLTLNFSLSLAAGHADQFCRRVQIVGDLAPALC